MKPKPIDELSCHSSTPKEDVIAFCEKHKGEIVVLHWEENRAQWGYDDFTDYMLDDHGMKDIIQTINNHYIHGIWTKATK